jgi:hypothetical protein
LVSLGEPLVADSGFLRWKGKNASHLPSHQRLRFVTIVRERLKAQDSDAHGRVRQEDAQPATAIADCFQDFTDSPPNHLLLGQVGPAGKGFQRSGLKLPYGHPAYLTR